MKWVSAAAFALLSQVAVAQTVPDEALQIIAGIEEDAGVSRHGPTVMGELYYDEEYDVFDMAVDPSKYSFIHVEGDDYTLGLKVSASVAGKEIAVEDSASSRVTLHIPPGSGSPIQVKIELTCEEYACTYFSQAFER